MKTHPASIAKPRPAVILLALSLLVIWGLWKISWPFVELRRQQLAQSPLKLEKHQLEQENQRLQHELQEMRSPEGMKIEAHKRGWLAPGERRLVFIAPEKASADNTPPSRQKLAWFSDVRTWSRQKAEHLARLIGY
jgi:hypothetical protein